MVLLNMIDFDGLDEFLVVFIDCFLNYMFVSF